MPKTDIAKLNDVQRATLVALYNERQRQMEAVIAPLSKAIEALAEQVAGEKGQYLFDVRPDGIYLVGEAQDGE